MARHALHHTLIIDHPTTDTPAIKIMTDRMVSRGKNATLHEINRPEDNTLKNKTSDQNHGFNRHDLSEDDLRSTKANTVPRRRA